MILYIKLITLNMLALLADFKKESNSIHKSATELLTRQEWILENYGYDTNKNGRIDASETCITDCEKDNTCAFRIDGTGILFDNSISCGNGITEQFFYWTFIDKALSQDLPVGTFNILQLTESKLIVVGATPAQDIALITVFTR